MTDKEKFRKEVEKLKSNLIYGACSSQIAMETMCKEEAYNEVLAILDTMQEEPVSEDLEEAVDSYTRKVLEKTNCLIGNQPVGEEISKAVKFGAKWQKTKDESITEDLGEYINELSKQFPEVSFAKLSRIAVRVAKWQKAKMMAKAIEGGCFSYKNGFVHISCDIDEHITDIKMGDKVKVIVIKED